MKRKIKALSATTFGSQASGLNKFGATVPNTNTHAIEGSNPVYNVEGLEFNDNISESSGDSVLIGVEEEPEFKGYTFKPELQGSVGPKKRRAPSPPMKNPPPTPPEYSDDDMSPIDMTGFGDSAVKSNPLFGANL